MLEYKQLGSAAIPILKASNMSLNVQIGSELVVRRSVVLIVGFGVLLLLLLLFLLLRLGMVVP